jgi:ABC-2 type transport system ATP-binding protein
VTAVSGVTLEVPGGVVFGLMGRNGAGKTSLIKMLLGLEPITAGSATVLGLDSERQSVRLRGLVGYVPEAHTMYRWMTVAEIARFVSAFYPTWDDALCAKLLDKYGLDPARRIKELSRGGVAKVALTLALAHRPKLLILDEPTDGLDAVVRKEFLESVVEVAAEEGRTVFISSHLLADMERVADRLALMDRSRVRFIEDTETLKARMREIKITFADGQPAGFEWPGAVSLRKERREWLMVVDNFTPDTPARLKAQLPGAAVEARTMTLEEIFIAMTGEDEA